MPLTFFGSQDRPSGIPSHQKGDSWGNRVLGRELMTSESPGYRDFPRGGEMESETVNVSPDLLSTIPGEGKALPLKGSLFFCGLEKLPLSSTQRERF